MRFAYIHRIALVCFAATILRSEISNACRSKQSDTNRMKREIDRIFLVLVLITDGSYSAINNLAIWPKQLLGYFNIFVDVLGTFVEEINLRNTNPIYIQMHQIPRNASIQKQKCGRPPKVKKKEAELPEETKTKRLLNEKHLPLNPRKGKEIVLRKVNQPKG